MRGNDVSNVVAFKPKRAAVPQAAYGAFGGRGIEHVYATMLHVLAEHAAHKLKIEQDTIEAMVKTAFYVRGFEELRKSDFECVGKYLVDLLDEHAIIH